MQLNKIYNESNLETMARMPDNSVDSIVTDPPYGLGNEPDPVEVLTAWLALPGYGSTAARSP